MNHILGLTTRQLECLRFIVDYMDENIVSPSYGEIAAGMGVASKANASRLLDGLEERGYIGRIRYRVRSISVLKRPPRLDPDPICTTCDDTLMMGDWKTISGVSVCVASRPCPDCKGGAETVKERGQIKIRETVK